MKLSSLLWILFPVYLAGAPPKEIPGSDLRIDQLQCEYLSDPAGLDIVKPRLGWRLSSARRGERQSAYRVIVASSPELLERERGDLWDSGQIDSDQTAQIEYGGAPLVSRQICVWKVMVWNKDGQPSSWSATARWSMGLLRPKDWQARWISDATLADPRNRPLTPIHCYRSALERRPGVSKWIVLDLGSSRRIDSVNLGPARPTNLNHDFRTVMFPLRFKIEVAEDPAFSTAKTVVDQTGADFDAPREDRPFGFPAINARYIRLWVTKLARWDGEDYAMALGAFSAGAGGKCVSDGARVTCSDSTESADYSKSYLEPDKKAVAIMPDSKAVTVDFPGVPAKRTVSRVPMLRKEFTLDAPIKRATLYVTARGFYEFHLNGRRVGNELLDPGYTDYAKRIPYQTFDITNLLRPGRNAMGALLGYGWYAGHMNLFDLRCIDGFFPLFLAQLEVEFGNGRRMTFATNGSWRTTLSGPVRWSDLLDGEGYDARLEMPGWDRPGFDDHAWKPAYSQDRDDVALVWPRCQPVRAIQEMRPISVKEVKPGIYLYDLGQEISGYCRLTVDGPAGAKVAMRHAEKIGPDGMIDVRNLWGVAAEDDCLLDGKGPHTFEPHFTYHGFRYVEVTGLPRPANRDSLVAIDIHTDAGTTGHFNCSNDLYNRLMAAARWTQWNLLFDVPAGCAARGERLAWLGDIRPCVQTAMFNMDTAAFFSKYTVDIREDQTADGRYCDITPHDPLRGTDVCVGAPGWADAGVSLPWQEYLNFGDRRILEEHYDSAKRWVDFVHARNPNLLWQNARGNDWGDWLSGGKPSTPKELGATAFFAHSVDLVSKMAEALGRHADSVLYRGLFDQIRQAFVKTYLRADGRIGNDAQGNYALALHFNLLDEPDRSQAAAHLLEAIARAHDHPTTGFWSSVEMLLALSDHGQNQAAARLLSVRTKPSWGYMVDHGTTLWESFDADEKNLSLDHWTHSAVGEWLWRNVAGINPDPVHPGYRSVLIRARPGDEVTWCDATYDSIRGPITVQWNRKDGIFTLNLAVPVGATADLYLPISSDSQVTESGVAPETASGVKCLGTVGGAQEFRVQSGTYHFCVSRRR